jgi:hypothetical protein
MRRTKNDDRCYPLLNVDHGPTLLRIKGPKILTKNHHAEQEQCWPTRTNSEDQECLATDQLSCWPMTNASEDQEDQCWSTTVWIAKSSKKNTPGPLAEDQEFRTFTNAPAPADHKYADHWSVLRGEDQCKVPTIITSVIEWSTMLKAHFQFQ